MKRITILAVTGLMVLMSQNIVTAQTDTFGAITFLPPDGFAWFHIDNGPDGGRPTGRLRFSYGVNPGDFEVMSLLQNGRVGIQKSNPAYPLDVSGTIRASKYVTSSDIQLKENIMPLTGMLEKLDNIQGVSFEWNDLAASQGEVSGQRSIGLIAQEVEAVFPEVVTEGDDHYKSVDYSRLTAVLIEAIKELKRENVELQQRLDVLEQQ